MFCKLFFNLTNNVRNTESSHKTYNYYISLNNQFYLEKELKVKGFIALALLGEPVVLGARSFLMLNYFSI